MENVNMNETASTATTATAAQRISLLIVISLALYMPAHFFELSVYPLGALGVGLSLWLVNVLPFGSYASRIAMITAGVTGVVFGITAFRATAAFVLTPFF